MDLVCDDYGIVNTPFSGSLAGPVSRKDSSGNQFDGVKLLNDGKKDKSIQDKCKKKKKLLRVIHPYLR